MAGTAENRPSHEVFQAVSKRPAPLRSMRLRAVSVFTLRTSHLGAPIASRCAIFFGCSNPYNLPYMHACVRMWLNTSMQHNKHHTQYNTQNYTIQYYTIQYIARLDMTLKPLSSIPSEAHPLALLDHLCRPELLLDALPRDGAPDVLLQQRDGLLLLRLRHDVPGVVRDDVVPEVVVVA